VASDPGRISPTPITHPKAVLAIAHPLRMRLLGELSRRGTARAVDLAGALGEPANSVSFHLRQLAKYGVIEENPDRAENGRERWWRQTSDRGFEIDLDAIRGAQGGDAAADTLRRVAEGHVLALHRTIHSQPGASHSSREEPDGERRTISDDFAVRLSDSELEQMRLEFEALLDRWTDASRANADDGHERHAYYGVVMAAVERDIASTAYGSRKDLKP
jgi:DNA-binding MarR family transcriptional regulator